MMPYGFWMRAWLFMMSNRPRVKAGLRHERGHGDGSVIQVRQIQP